MIRPPSPPRLFPGRKCPTRESLLRVGLEPAEAFTGDSAVAADLWATQPAILGQVNGALRRAKRLQRREISA